MPFQGAEGYGLFVYSCNVPAEIEFIKEGDPVTEIHLRFPYYRRLFATEPEPLLYEEEPWGHEQLLPLQATPYIQLVRYWERYGDESVRTMGPNQSETLTVKTTVGTVKQATESFGYRVGALVGASGFGVSASINMEFSYNYTTSLTDKFEETVTKSTTITTGDNEHVILVGCWRFCTWKTGRRLLLMP